MRPAHTSDWPRTRRSDEPSNDPGPSSPRQFCPDCIIATPGYDFQEGQVRRGLPSSPLVLRELPFLSELHKVHYARYPQVETKPVPAHISEYNDVLDQLFGDIENALGGASHIKA